MGRRGNGEGSIFQLPNKKWRVVISAGTLPNGKPRRITRTLNKRADAAAVLLELKAASAAGRLDPTRMTVGHYLDSWIEKVKLDRAIKTHDSYSLAVRLHLRPRIGGLRLAELSPANLRWMLTEMVREKIGARTRQNAYTVLRIALQEAVRHELISANPCLSVQRPKAPRESIWPLTREEATKLLTETVAHPDHVFYALALTLGMRQGEIFGLHWTEVDLRAGTILIDQQLIDLRGTLSRANPKSQSSRRTLQLPEPALAALAAQRARLLKAGEARNPIVCPGRDGAYQRPNNFRRRAYKETLASLGIDYRGAHHLRHTFATLALGAGVPVTVVSQILGHSNPATTLRIYAHVLSSQQTDAVATISRLFA